MGTETGEAEAETHAHDKGDLDRAWETHQAEIRAVEVKPGARANADVIRLAGYALAVAERIAPEVDRLAETSPAPLVTRAALDRLVGLARAAMWAGVEATSTSRTKRPVAPLMAEAMRLRPVLDSAIRAKHARRAQEPREPGAPAPAMVAVPKLEGRSPAQWSVLIAKLVRILEREGLDGTPLTPDDLERASVLVVQLLRAARPGDVAPPLAEARRQRLQALVLLRTHYDEIRTAFRYVFRHEPKKMGMMPPLWKGRGQNVGKRKRVRVPREKKARESPSGFV
jgi:hypothetical protein